MQVTLNAPLASLAEFQNLSRNTEEVVAGFLFKGSAPVHKEPQ